MKNRLYYFLMLVLLFPVMACQEKNTTETEPSENGTNRATTVQMLQGNPKIAIGPLQKKSHQQEVACTGTLEIPPTDLVSIHSQMSGTIAYMKFLPGDFVPKGSVLFRITEPGLISRQRVFLETWEKLKLAQKEFERKELLSRSGAIHDKEFQEAESWKNELSVSYAGYEKELQMLGIDTDKLKSDLDYQSFISVVSPISGYVREVLVNKGQLVSPEEKLMDIANDDHVHLELHILSRDIPLVRIGQQVSFMLPNNDRKLKAKIVKLNPVLDGTSGTLQVHCHIDTEDCRSILPGMFVNAIIQADQREVTGLPAEAVVKEGSNLFAYKKSGDQLIRIQLKNVERTDDFVIFEGNPLDSFVVKGAYYLE